MSCVAPRIVVNLNATFDVFFNAKTFLARRLSVTHMVQTYFQFVNKQSINEVFSMKQESRKEQEVEIVFSVLISCDDRSTTLSDRVPTVPVRMPTKKIWSQNLVYVCQYMLSLELMLSQQRKVLSLVYLEKGSEGFVR